MEQRTPVQPVCPFLCTHDYLQSIEVQCSAKIKLTMSTIYPRLQIGRIEAQLSDGADCAPISVVLINGELPKSARPAAPADCWGL